DSCTKNTIRIAVIKNKIATNKNTLGIDDLVAIAPPIAGPAIAAIPIPAPVKAIVFPRVSGLELSTTYAKVAGINKPPASPWKKRAINSCHTVTDNEYTYI